MDNQSNDCACDDTIELKNDKEVVFKVIDFKNPLISIVLIVLAFIIYHYSHYQFSSYFFMLLLLTSYLFVGFNVLKKAFQLCLKGDFLNEFVFMSIATIAAF